MDFRKGGVERIGSRLGPDTPFPGVPLVSDGVYLDIVQDRIVVVAATMTLGGKCISAAMGTFEILATERGSDLIFTYQAAFFEGADGPEMRKAGWEKLLGQLGAEIDRG